MLNISMLLSVLGVVIVDYFWGMETKINVHYTIQGINKTSKTNQLRAFMAVLARVFTFSHSEQSS